LNATADWKGIEIVDNDNYKFVVEDVCRYKIRAENENSKLRVRSYRADRSEVWVARGKSLTSL